MKFKLPFCMAASTWLIVPSFAQDANKVILNDASPAAVSTTKDHVTACPLFARKDWPVSLTIQARLTEFLNSSYLRPGQEVFAKVLYPITYADCSLTHEAILYGHVTDAASSKNPNSSELGLIFDHADCQGRQKQQLPMRLIGLVAPRDQSSMLH